MIFCGTWFAWKAKRKARKKTNSITRFLHFYQMVGTTTHILCIICVVRGGSKIFSRGGGGGFSKNFRKFWRSFFLGRSDWFSELSQSSKKTLFWPNFLRRRQFLEKTGQKKLFLGTFWKTLTKKSRFFWRALPLKISIYWRLRRL